MKRDLDLIRKILFAVEDHADGFAPHNLAVDGYTAEQIGFHVLLMGQAGLVKAVDVTPHVSKSPQWTVIHMSWEGYEFLDAARKQSIWDAAKSKLSAVGAGFTFDLVKEILLTIVRRELTTA